MAATLSCAASATTVRFGVIGDFGWDGTPELQVSQLIKSWNPDFIVTVGDDNYDNGYASTIDKNIGKYFHDYIYNYTGTYGAGSSSLRFLPCPGNHDWGNKSNNPTGLDPYLAYFTLPGNERYYSFSFGPVELFSLDTDTNEPDGVTSTSVQAAWCQQAMLASKARWKIPVLHHAPYSSGQHGSTTYMRWPFASWGANAVLAGHDHTYERLLVGNVPYFVNGLGGRSIYSFGTVLPESVVRYNGNYGAMLVEANELMITFRFYNRSYQLIDQFQLLGAPLSTGPHG